MRRGAAARKCCIGFSNSCDVKVECSSGVRAVNGTGLSSSIVLAAPPHLRRRDHLAGGQLQPVKFHFTTTGGDCQSAVKASWSKLLQRMGLNPNFYFDGEQFKKPPPPRRPAVELPQQRRPAGGQAMWTRCACLLRRGHGGGGEMQGPVCVCAAGAPACQCTQAGTMAVQHPAGAASFVPAMVLDFTACT